MISGVNIHQKTSTVLEVLSCLVLSCLVLGKVLANTSNESNDQGYTLVELCVKAFLNLCGSLMVAI